MNGQKQKVVIKPAKLHYSPVTNPKNPVTQKASTSDHDYASSMEDANEANAMAIDAQTSKRERGGDSTPATPAKQPSGKKTKPTEEEEGESVSNKTIFEAILGLEKKFEVQLEDIKEQTRQSTAMIANLAKAVEFNAAEMEDCKKRVSILEKTNGQLHKDNRALTERVREQERYRMRWCLRVKGMKEDKEEDIRKKTIQMLQRVAPDLKLEEAVDVVHGLGKRAEGRHRNVIVLFAQRHIKEDIWRRTKDSAVCKQEGIRLAEMLPQEDLEERGPRRRLWPLIEEARRAGKRAYFRGPHGFVDGQKIEG